MTKIQRAMEALDDVLGEQRDNFDKLRDLRRIEKAAKRMADLLEERLKAQGLTT